MLPDSYPIQDSYNSNRATVTFRLDHDSHDFSFFRAVSDCQILPSMLKIKTACPHDKA